MRQVAADEAAPLAACAALSAICFADHPAQQWGADQLAQHIRQNENALFAAYADETLVGFALFTQVAGEGELASICSDPAKRRQGYGAALLRHGLAVLQPHKMVLEVAAPNMAAIRLYEGLGFVEIARRNAYYRVENGPATDALVMAWSRPK